MRVLACIKGLDSDFVQTQFPFEDSDGKQRRCDFVIQEGRVVRIALEVDGYDKTGTGSGMTRDQFVDWQRRQAALVAQGWRLLRFANTDVRDRPDLCQEHISLLLRRERESSEHREELERSIQQLQDALVKVKAQNQSTIDTLAGQLEQLQAERVASSGQQHGLEARIRELQSQLAEAKLEREIDVDKLRVQIKRAKTLVEYAEKAKPLTRDEVQHLAQLDAAQQQINVLAKENSTMKTTIWAFTALLAVVIIAFSLYASRSDLGVVSGASTGVAVTNAPSAPDSVLLSPSFTPSRLDTTSRSASPLTPPVTSQQVVAAGKTHTSATAAVGTSCANPLRWQDASKFIGEWVAVGGPVKGIIQSTQGAGKPTWINVGAPFPNPERLTLVIWKDQRQQFEMLLSELDRKIICAEGRVTVYKGQPQIELRAANQLFVH